MGRSEDAVDVDEVDAYAIGFELDAHLVVGVAVEPVFGLDGAVEAEQRRGDGRQGIWGQPAKPVEPAVWKQRRASAVGGVG